jgi:hypothetical protein
MRESDELVSAFTELEAFVRGTSRLPGLAAAQSEAARRRRGRIAVWSAAAAVVLVLGGAATVVAGWLPRSGMTGLEPSPSPSVTTAPTPSPSVTTGPVPATVLADMTPPEQLRNATIDVPAFDLAGCPSGRLEFRDEAFVSSVGAVLMDAAAVGDVDADGTEDIVVALRCAPGGSGHVPSSVQVLAYSGPGLALLGSVPTGGLTRVASLLVRPDGDVELGMARADGVQGIVFDRYRWGGSGFERIDGVDVPGDALPVVAVSAEPTAVQLVPGGPSTTIVVTVRNEGPDSDLPLQLTVVGTEPATVEVEGLTSPTVQSRHDLVIVAPEAGQAVTVTLRVALPAGATLPVGSSVLVAAYPTDVNTSSFTVALQA